MRRFWQKVRERDRIKYEPFVQRWCQEYDDGFDGFVIHAATCPHYQDSAVSSSRCIQLARQDVWPSGLR